MGKPIPAAQYIRMSSESQRYSSQNQAQAITRYAQRNGYKIITTYHDHGKSGLSLRGREGLKRLLADVMARRIAFEVILVLDVSRWGRFQDPDEAAHYEFICREAGVQVIYCMEPLLNEDTSISVLVKDIKRIMAGEYSRELGCKIKAGCLTSASFGYKQGGPAPYGLRRAILDEEGQVLMILEYGARCRMPGKGVVFIPGAASEIETLRRIYSLYCEDEFGLEVISRILLKEGRKDDTNKPFTPGRLRQILTQETYTGVYTYNRKTVRLQSPLMHNPPHL